MTAETRGGGGGLCGRQPERAVPLYVDQNIIEDLHLAVLLLGVHAWEHQTLRDSLDKRVTLGDGADFQYFTCETQTTMLLPLIHS